jgi:hypothetical protein
VVEGKGAAAYDVDGSVEVVAFAGDEVAAARDLYVVEGNGMASMFSRDGDGACDIRRPICTVADDAIEESRRWRGPPV